MNYLRMFLAETPAQTNWFPLPVFVLPATDRVLQAGQARGIGFSLPLIFDESLHGRTVSANFAEEIVE